MAEKKKPAKKRAPGRASRRSWAASPRCSPSPPARSGIILRRRLRQRAAQRIRAGRGHHGRAVVGQEARLGRSASGRHRVHPPPGRTPGTRRRTSSSSSLAATRLDPVYDDHPDEQLLGWLGRRAVRRTTSTPLRLATASRPWRARQVNAGRPPAAERHSSLAVDIDKPAKAVQLLNAGQPDAKAGQPRRSTLAPGATYQFLRHVEAARRDHRVELGV